MSSEGENAAPAGQEALQGGAPSNPLMNAPASGPASTGRDVTASQQQGFDEAGLEDQAWIEKSRVVIARSSGDPFVRHDAISQLKVQYLKQRFGKDLGSKQG